MIVTIDAGSKQVVGSIMVEAWKLGVEIEQLQGNQLELTATDDMRLVRLISRFPSAKILHKEKIKEVSWHEQ